MAIMSSACFVAVLFASAQGFTVPAQVAQSAAAVPESVAHRQSLAEPVENTSLPWASSCMAVGMAMGLALSLAAAPVHAEELKIDESTGKNKVKGNNRVANRPYGFLKEDSTISKTPEIEDKLAAKLGGLEKYNARLFDKDKEDTMWSQAYKA
mmetsp:Transcript_61167/g.113529  ORF Transcript_61167/g.113529 Transcript_61167/m.113529 type:complete len:153 (-) Transcript_61167:138-596(-)